MVTVFGFDRNGNFDSDFGGVGGFVRYDDYAALEARVAELEKDAARYRWLQKTTSHKFGKFQAASEVDAADVIYFDKLKFDELVDEAMSREA